MLKSLAKLFKREPDLVFHNKNGEYLRRWYIVPRNTFSNVMLHRFVGDDDDRAMHDHPWWSASFVLKGCYWEWTIRNGQKVMIKRKASWRPILRDGQTPHRIILDRPGKQSCWTLFLTGPRFRSWGFHCPQEWRHWRDFVSPDDRGTIGRGCD